jgi:serine protease Do
VRDGFGEVVEKLRRSTVQVKAGRHGGGSGVVWSSSGQIVTNAHVVDGAGAVEVEFWDGGRFAARIGKRDRRRDLALLEVEASGLPAAASGDSNALRVGELVIAVGNPMGFIGAASTGVVHRVEYRSWVVSRLRLAPGNSGGPLANACGEVVGINTMIAGGLAFAIPSRSVTQFLNAQAHADSGLGVVVRPTLAGLIVLEVIPQSPADRASLLQGDILVGVFGKRFQSTQDPYRAIRTSQGGLLELQFRRGASTNIRTVAVQMASASVRAA